MESLVGELIGRVLVLAPVRYLVVGVVSAGVAFLAGQSWWITLCAFFIGPFAISWVAWAVAPLFRR